MQSRSNSVDMIYIDPPFNTGHVQSLLRQQGAEPISYEYYNDNIGNYSAFMLPRLRQMRRVLKPHGSLYLHCDWREVHHLRCMLDSVFEPRCFVNEIIWAYDYGARQHRCWPRKHDNILVYAKTPNAHYFNTDEVDRIPYMAPALQHDQARAFAGKVPTDVWWHTIVPTNGAERTGYPTQKPLGIVKRAIVASCPPGGVVADYFAGSGTTGEAALLTNRNYLMVDDNLAAIAIMERRLNEQQTPLASAEV
jgi:site-specific DNA-methyltransferase (adenine-specific)